MSHLNSPSLKNNSCMHCMPMILLFVQSTVSSFYFVCFDYIENCSFFSLLCLVVLFSWILRIARSLLRLSISFKSCTMLFSSLFNFQVNIYITVCFNLNFFPILESSSLFFSLILLSLILINELFALFCLTLVSRAMFSPNFISIIRSPFLFFSIC